MDGMGGVGGGKWRQRYLNNNKKMKKEINVMESNKKEFQAGAP